MISKCLRYLCCTILLFALSAAANNNSAANNPATPSTTSLNTQPTAAIAQNLFLCPPITALKKNPDPHYWNWTASGGWKSYGISFVTQIKEFAGAQWTGTNVGQLTCVYKGTQVTDFPILLIYHALTLEPSGGKWTQNLGGYRNCLSLNQVDCAFKVRLKPQQQNIYQQLQNFKSDQDNNELQNPGF